MDIKSKGSSKGRILSIDYTIEQPSIRSRQRYRGGSTVLVVLMLAMILLTGCADVFGPSKTELADSPRSIPAATEPQISLEPSSGTVGTFVTVTGQGWKPSTMIAVKLTDGEGQSNVLAADNTNESGEFSTGFLYPVGDRWTQPGSYMVAVSLQDDEVDVAKPFVFESPVGAADEGVAIPTLILAPTATLMATATPETPEPTVEPTSTEEVATPQALQALNSSAADSGGPIVRNGSYELTENDQNLTLTCDKHSAVVKGSGNTVTLLGSCESIIVRGNANMVFYQAAASITNSGSNNLIQQR